MIMRLVLPRYEKVHFLSGICSLFLRKEDEVHYIGGAEILPPPLEESGKHTVSGCSMVCMQSGRERS